jgi:hypothetical protein
MILFSFSLSLKALNISGTIYYERVQPHHTDATTRLDYSNITKETAKEVQVEVIDATGNQVASTFTNAQGEYIFKDIESFTTVKIRVLAKMFKKDSWDVKVIDNNRGNALYVIEGELEDTGSTDTIRELIAPSSTHSSAPFAILDSIYQAMSKIHTVAPSVNFPLLKINWSVNNITIGTYYDGEDNIFLLGDQKGDSDEYDGHIVIHEWGHFFENRFSRADNIGGRHGTGNHLDSRVAFGEGFGNALSAMVTDNPIYFDTIQGNNNGWNMNIENAYHETPGWFSEASIQRILYDLYDTHNENKDHLSLGFKPIYDVLVGGQKVTPAFTTIFSFINELKKLKPSDTEKIDDIVSSEGIATIEESYGLNRISNIQEDVLPLYTELMVGKMLQEVCITNKYGLYNKLGTHKYIYFTIRQQNTYPITIEQSNGKNADPDFTLFKRNPFEKLTEAKSGKTGGVEEISIALTAGSYLLDLTERSGIDKACFNLSIREINGTMENNKKRNSSVAIILPSNSFWATIILLGLLFLPLLFIRKELKL